MRDPRRWAGLLLAVQILVACGSPSNGPADERTLNVFAAASLRDVLTEVGTAFEKKNQVRLQFNFAGSNTLAQQISAAPVADLFVSADESWIRFVEEKGLTVPGSRQRLFDNRLVLIANHQITNHQAPDPLNDLCELRRLDFRHFAVADPRAVPAGRYAKAHLSAVQCQGENLWTTLRENLVPTLDVRAAMALVEGDSEIVGMVYKTDAATSNKVRVLYELPFSAQVPISYWATIIRNDKGEGSAQLFLDFMTGPEGRRIAGNAGFMLTPTSAAHK